MGRVKYNVKGPNKTQSYKSKEALYCFFHVLYAKSVKGKVKSVKKTREPTVLTWHVCLMVNNPKAKSKYCPQGCRKVQESQKIGRAA